MTVSICVPSGDLLHTDFALSLAAIMAHEARAGRSPRVHNVRRSHIDLARQELVETALAAGAESLLFLDSDMSFPPDTVQRLVGHKRQVVGATCPSRPGQAPYIHGKPLAGQDMNAPRGLIRMEAIGAGCLLVDRAVFAKLPRPWFGSYWEDDGRNFVGEDYAFCRSARARGFQLFCDLELSHELGHMGVSTRKWERAPA